MKIGLVGYPGSGKSTVFGALTALPVETGYGSRGDKANIGVVKVPDPRVDALAEVIRPKKIVHAEITFTDLGGGRGGELDRGALDAMRQVDALCQVVRGFPDPAGAAPEPLAEIAGLETEIILADLAVAEPRIARLEKDRSDPRELALLKRIHAWLEDERPLRSAELDAEERKQISGYSFLTLKPLLLVLNVSEEAAGAPPSAEVAQAAAERGLELVALSARVEHEIAQMAEDEQREFLASFDLDEPAKNRFIRAAYASTDLISMLTARPDECRAWPVPRGTPASRAAGKIHSDIERGFIRAEVIHWRDLVDLGSETRCREAGKLRVEGRDYAICDGDVVRFRFNV